MSVHSLRPPAEMNTRVERYLAGLVDASRLLDYLETAEANLQPGDLPEDFMGDIGHKVEELRGLVAREIGEIFVRLIAGGAPSAEDDA